MTSSTLETSRVVTPSHTMSRAAAASVPWVLPAMLFASTCIVVGLIWDISWHRTVGRDTFWTYPHLLEQLAAIVSGLGCGWLVLKTTFAGSEPERATSVRFWGFRGPLGAWVCIWGTIMMLTSAPFDDWWHNAYGLDVKILSPPHMVLALGMVAIQIGALLLAYAVQNRSNDNTPRLGMYAAYASAILVTMVATVIMEHASFPNTMHGSIFYILTGALFPFVLVALSRPSRLRWPATTIAALYMMITLVMMWVLPLFPATAKLAPIYNAVTHMVPPPFPTLLVIPAVAIDLLLRRQANDWWRALLIGIAFVAILAVVQWNFADFLLSPAARNIVFGADQWDYTVKLGAWRYEYWNLDATPALFWQGMGIATVLAILSARLGLVVGKALTYVKR